MYAVIEQHDRGVVTINVHCPYAQLVQRIAIYALELLTVKFEAERCALFGTWRDM